MTPDRPRIAVYLFDSSDPERLAETLSRFPASVRALPLEVVIVQGPAQGFDPLALAADAESKLPLRLHRLPREVGHGGARKAAFEDALARGVEHVVTMRGDGSQPPEALPDLLFAAREGRQPLVLGSRLLDRREALEVGMPVSRLAAHSLTTGLLNRTLGLKVRDWLTSFRVYATRQLRDIPFQLDSDDRLFDIHLAVQFRALGEAPHEVAVHRVWREAGDRRDELDHVLRACRSAIGYRLHQLHFTRRGRYLIDVGIHYTLKRSPHGSHMQIVEAIEPGARVLDLGCSQGLLAAPLHERGVRTVGVDARAEGEHLASELEAYHRRDLESPLEIPEERSFDCVVCADVLEHIRNGEQLLRSARRYLRSEGRLIISTPNIALWFYRLSLLVGRFEYGPRGVLDQDHVHLYTRDTFRRTVERAGFHIVREHATSLPFEVVFESTGRSRLMRTAASLYHRLATAWPELFAYQIILEAEITTLDADAEG